VYNATLVNSTSREEVGDQLAYAMKLIIIPLLSRSFELGQHEIVGDATVDSMVKDMFDPAEEVQGEVAPGAIQGILEFIIIIIIITIIIIIITTITIVIIIVIIIIHSRYPGMLTQIAVNSKSNLASRLQSETQQAQLQPQ